MSFDSLSGRMWIEVHFKLVPNLIYVLIELTFNLYNRNGKLPRHESRKPGGSSSLFRWNVDYIISSQILCKTWKKTYSNLYDYTAQPNSVDLKVYNIVQQTRILKSNGKYELIPYENRDQASHASIDAVIDFV
jgi:hypothetical protein